MQASKILSEETTFESKFFKVKRVAIERDGKQFAKDIIERRNVVLILPMTKQDELYLVSQHRDALQKQSLEIVAGQMDDGEDPYEAARRELVEETGLRAQNLKLLAMWYQGANMIGKNFLFLATELEEGEASPDDDEDITTVKLPLGQVIEKVERGEIDVVSNVASLLLLDKMKKEGKI